MSDKLVEMKIIRTPEEMRLYGLATAIRADISDCERSREQWRQSVISLCKHMAEARDQFPDNISFGKWCDENNIELNKDDRAAAIAMGRDIEQARKVLEVTERRSLQLICAKEFRVLSAKKTGSKRKSPTLDSTLDIIAQREQAGKPINREAIVEEAGVSRGIADSALAAHRKHREGVEEGQLLAQPISASAQQKLDARQRQMEKEFDNRVYAAAQKMLVEWKEVALKHWDEKLRETRRALGMTEGYSGPSVRKPMTKAQFYLLVKCLHEDAFAQIKKDDPEMISNFKEALQMLNELRPKLADDEKERKIISTLPTAAEMVAAREARRREHSERSKKAREARKETKL